VARPFTQVDVFTDALTLGNPVAVVHDADGISDEQMAAFARWTNLSETTFLLAPTAPEADYRLRIFTPARELPFAGHPTLGSARAWLEAGGRAHSAGELVQECGAGLVRIRRDGSRLAFAAPALIRGGPVSAADLAEIAGSLQISVGDIVDAQWADNGPGWVAVLLGDAEAVLALSIPGRSMGSLHHIGVVGPYPPGSECAFEVRAFTSLISTGEDPVTGSLNASVAQWLIAAGHAPPSYVAAQGTALRRRGRIYLDQIDGQVWVGGETVVGVSGSVSL
jgi:PhzF family phenazine biosynthesis protein